MTYRPTTLAGGFEAYRVNGTPSDCVALGVHQWSDVDVVLSGINLGSNLGNAIWHSGTLAAAKQASLLGMRGIALSAPAVQEPPDFEVLQPHISHALEMLLPLKEFPLLNVNFPEKPPRGHRWTRQSVRHYDGKVVPSQDPMGRTIFWFTVIPIEASEEGTDRWAVEHGLVSITPLTLDLTDHALLERAHQVTPEAQAHK